MEKYLNQLECFKYGDPEGYNPRESLRPCNLTNLFIDLLPGETTEKDLFDLGSFYGDVVSIKMKTPLIAGLTTLQAYIAFKTQEQASKALKSMNGIQLIPGTDPIKVEFYIPQNQFKGVYRGLDRNELVNNTHFRVLFLKGLSHEVS